MFENRHFPEEMFWMKPVISSLNDPLIWSCEQRSTRGKVSRQKEKLELFSIFSRANRISAFGTKETPFPPSSLKCFAEFFISLQRMLVYALHFNGIYCFCTKQPEEKRRKKCFEARIMPVALYKCIFPFIHLQWIFALLSGALGCVLEREYNNNFA